MSIKTLTAALAFAVGASLPAAAQSVTVMTSWFAQAEHGGFYAAKALGLYDEEGLDVTIKMGGPQVNGMQLLLAGESDFIMGYDLQVLKAREQDIPLVAVGTSFQFDLAAIMAHPDVKTLGDIGDRTILIGSSSHSTFWPWMKVEYGYTDSQIRPYTFNLQPFFVDDSVVQQAYVTSEPFQAQQQGEDVNVFLLADSGYPPYGGIIVTTDQYVADNPETVEKFVRATMKGWLAYLEDPAPADKLIQADNSKMTDEQLAYSIKQLKERGAVTGGDAATLGAGIMTDARWKKTYEFMRQTGLLEKDIDYKAAFTDRFVKDLQLTN